MYEKERERAGKSRVLVLGWGWALSEPRGWVRLQMYTQCSGAQAKGWIPKCCCFSRAACFSSLSALFFWMPRAAIHRRCLSSSRRDALSHPTSSIRTAPVLMSLNTKKKTKNTQGTEIQPWYSCRFHSDVICHQASWRDFMLPVWSNVCARSAVIAGMMLECGAVGNCRSVASLTSSLLWDEIRF